MIEATETNGGAYARHRNCQQSRNTSQPDANVQYFPAPSQLLASFQGPHGTRHTDARSLKFDYCTIVHKFVFSRRDGR